MIKRPSSSAAASSSSLSSSAARSMGGAVDEARRGGYSFALLTPDTRLEILCSDLQVALYLCV